MKWSMASGIGLMGMALALAAVLATAPSCGTPVTGKPFDPAAPTFPTVAGDNLNGRRIEFPQGLDAPYAILLVAFYQQQQTDVNTWLGEAKAIVADHANVEYYELPTISGSWTIARGWIDGGMRRGIPAFADRERTVTLYTDTDEFRRLSGIDNPARIWSGLIDRMGRVYWSARGPATPQALADLRKAVREVAAPGLKSLGSPRDSSASPP